MDSIQVVLASGSPRRIEILRRNGIEPNIIRPEVDETVPPGLTPEQAVMYLALKKALSVEQQLSPQRDQWLIAADTIVYQETIMGKPQNEQEAWDMLRCLRGKEHRVITGVVLLCPKMPQRQVFAETTVVCFRNYDDRTIREYIDSGEVWDKAGAYAIQGSFGRQVERISGDFDNVVGLPWKRISKELSRMIKGTYRSPAG